MSGLRPQYHVIASQPFRSSIRSHLCQIAIGLSCTAFRDPSWVARYRPEWPSNLKARLKLFATEVDQPVIPLPPKGSPPTRGELEF